MLRWWRSEPRSTRFASSRRSRPQKEEAHAEGIQAGERSAFDRSARGRRFDGAGRARCCAGGHRDGLERERVDRAIRRGGAGAAGIGAAHGNGARSRLRRGERDRRPLRGLPAHVTSGAAVRLEGGGDRDRGVPRAAAPRSGAAGRARRAVRRLAGGDSGRLGEDARDQSRGGRCGGDDRGQDGRRPLRRLSLPGRLGSRRVAPGAAGVRQRPERLVEGRAAVPARERHAVHVGRSGSAHELVVHQGLRRGEVPRVGDEHDPHRRPDPCRPLLGREPAGDLEPDLPDVVRTAGAVARRQRASVRDAVHVRCRRADHGLERQGARPVLAADHGDS